MVRARGPASASTWPPSRLAISTSAHPDKAISSTANRQSLRISSPVPAAAPRSVTAAIMRARRSVSCIGSPGPAARLRDSFPHRTSGLEPQTARPTLDRSPASGAILSKEDDLSVARCIACRVDVIDLHFLPGWTARGAPDRRLAAAPLDLQIRRIQQFRIYLRLRRARLRMASTFAANAVGSMIGVPSHGDIDSRSVPLETMSSAPTSAARSRIDRGLRVYAGQGPFRLIGMGAQSRKRTCAQGYGDRGPDLSNLRLQSARTRSLVVETVWSIPRIFRIMTVCGHRPSVFRPDISQVGADRASVMRVAGRCW